MDIDRTRGSGTAWDPDVLKADIVADAAEARGYRERGNARDYARAHRRINRNLDELELSEAAQ